NKKWHDDGMYYPLNDLNIEDFLKAFHIGYEVEKTKLVNGDKVVYPKVGDIGTVKGDMVFWNDGSKTEVDYTMLLIEDGDMNLATEEDIYWLETLNRDKIFGFKIGDAILDDDGRITPLATDYQVSHAVEYFTDRPSRFKAIYPVESLKRFKED